MRDKVKILIIEDYRLEYLGLIPNVRACFSERDVKTSISHAENLEEAQSLLQNNFYDFAIFDLDLHEERLAGLKLLEEFKRKVRYCVISTSHDDKKIIARGYELGANDYIVKPSSKDKLQFLTSNFLKEISKEKVKAQILKRFITQDDGTIESLLGLATINRESLSSFFINAPTGSGKQVVAKLIHELVNEEEGSFIEVNCSELKGDLGKSIIFGHMKGAFTDAISDRKGVFELANGGTIFLDEIAKLSLSFQGELLKVLEEKKIKRVGSNQEKQIDFKLVTACHENLWEMVCEGRFLKDLYFRLQGLSIEIKGLAQRKEDILFQIDHFMKSHKSGRRFALSLEAMDFLSDYHWPGNTRELIHWVNSVHAKGINRVELSDLEEFKSRPFSDEQTYITQSILDSASKLGLDATLENIAKEIVNKFYADSGKKVRETTRKLNINNYKFYKYVES